jgi:hypothetical protein
MHCPIRSFLVGILLSVLPSSLLAQVNPFQGIYVGRALIRVSGHGYLPRYYPARMTVLPDGHSIIFATQLSNDVSNRVFKGGFTNNVFEGFSRGRFNVKIYNWAVRCKITFIRNEARINMDSVDRPPGYVEDPREDKPLIFYRVRS